MPTLLLTLSGPLQAWGSGSRFSTRQTEPAPTKSGVIGLLAAARGVRRTEPLTELVGLRFGVRSDQPGRIVRDFQTARSLDGKESMPLSDRYYLGDAVFLAALESEDRGLLEGILRCLRSPVFPLYLGRRSCPPAGPIPAEIVDASVEDAFEQVPWLAASAHQEQHRFHPYVEVETRIDARPGERGTERLRDVPVSFDPEQRRHIWREVEIGRVWLANPGFGGGNSEPDGKDEADGSGEPGAGPDAGGPDSGTRAGVDTGAGTADPHDVFAAFPEGE